MAGNVQFKQETGQQQFDASGNLKVNIAATSGGADTQYTEADVDTTITGTAAMGESAGDVLNPIQLDASKNLKVAVNVALPAGTAAIGKLAANSGVDIGDVDVTSSALPTGASTLAEQQTQTASLSVMDDWDESDRAKVNPIAGQAGVQGGSGTTNALTQRVVLATDVALPTGTNTIGTVAFGTSTTGGYSIYRNLDTGVTGANPKGSAGQIYGYYMANNASSVRYVKLYNKASAPTQADTPVITIALPATTAANMNLPHGIAFGTGIGIRGTTGVADNDTGAPTTNDIIVNIYYA